MMLVLQRLGTSPVYFINPGNVVLLYEVRSHIELCKQSPRQFEIQVVQAKWGEDKLATLLEQEGYLGINLRQTQFYSYLV